MRVVLSSYMGLESRRQQKAEAALKPESSLKLWDERFAKAARIASLAFMLQPTPSIAAEVGMPTQDEQKQIDLMLERSPSVGSIETASGQVIQIPKEGERFHNVAVYMPRGKAPERIVIFFQQLHQDTAGEIKGVSNEEKQKILDAVESSQEKIYEELLSLRKAGSISTVCHEGDLADEVRKLTPEQIADSLPAETVKAVSVYKPDVAAMYKRYEELQRIGSDKGLDKEEINELETLILPKFAEVATQYRYMIGAGRVLASEGKIALCGAEEPETYNAGWKPEIRSVMEKDQSTWTQAETNLIRRVVVHDREMAALNEVSKQEGSAVALSYGNAHQYTASIAEYNSVHADHPLALVQIDAGVPYKKDMTVTVGAPAR